MQVILRVDIPVEQYNEQCYHKRVRIPQQCGNCAQFGTLATLGYYRRYTTDAKGIAVQIHVARFRCGRCGRTTSCLPCFALTYRLVACKSVEAFFCGDITGNDVRRCEGLLVRYLERCLQRHEWLRDLVGSRFGRGPPGESATAFLRRAVAACGSLAELTALLIQEFSATCFGTYCCHQPTFPH